jgi:TRAP-type uncharacterized transport system substrate-binding protein
MWGRFWNPWIALVFSAAIILAALYIIYSWVDPLPPRHLAIAAGAVGSGYDKFARQYARILARDGVELKIRNSAGAVEDLDLLRDPASGMQAALTAFGVAQPADAATLYSLGGIFDAFFTATPSPSRSLLNSVASAFRLACRELPCERFYCRF